MARIITRLIFHTFRTTGGVSISQGTTRMVKVTSKNSKWMNHTRTTVFRIHSQILRLAFSQRTSLEDAGLKMIFTAVSFRLCFETQNLNLYSVADGINTMAHTSARSYGWNMQATPSSVITTTTD